MITIGGGMIVTLAMYRPDLAASVESRLHAHGGFYQQRAGTREARVSAARSWSDHLREFRPIDPFARAVAASWRAEGRSHPPRWIVADDYGLAAQLAWVWREVAPRVVTPTDAMFQGGIDALDGPERRQAVFVAALGPLERIEPESGHVREIASLNHPVTGAPVRIGVMKADADSLSYR
jgi:hypothetical protein